MTSDEDFDRYRLLTLDEIEEERKRMKEAIKIAQKICQDAGVKIHPRVKKIKEDREKKLKEDNEKK